MAGEQLHEKILGNVYEVRDFAKVLHDEVVSKYGMVLGNNTRLVDVSCADDHSTSVLDHLISGLYEHDKIKGSSYCPSREGAEAYERRPFGGLLIPNHHTYEDFVPATHHLAAHEGERYLLVLQLSHIGYDSTTERWGAFVRYYDDHASASCGALVGIYNSLKNNGNAPDFKSMDLKSLASYVKGFYNGGDILEFTYKALQDSISYGKKIFEELAKKENINVVYIGGLEIDTNKGKDHLEDDLIYVEEAVLIKPNGDKERIDI